MAEQSCNNIVDNIVHVIVHWVQHNIVDNIVHWVQHMNMLTFVYNYSAQRRKLQIVCKRK